MVSEKLHLFEQKKERLEDMLDRLVNWDQSADTAHLILDKNQQSIEEIIGLDQCLFSEDLAEFTGKHRWLIEQVIAVQERLITAIKKESAVLADQMNQMNRKDKVVSHYMEKEKSLFVDRDV